MNDRIFKSFSTLEKAARLRPFLEEIKDQLASIEEIDRSNKGLTSVHEELNLSHNQLQSISEAFRASWKEVVLVNLMQINLGSIWCLMPRNGLNSR